MVDWVWLAPPALLAPALMVATNTPDPVVVGPVTVAFWVLSLLFGRESSAPVRADLVLLRVSPPAVGWLSSAASSGWAVTGVEASPAASVGVVGVNVECPAVAAPGM